MLPLYHIETPLLVTSLPWTDDELQSINEAMYERVIDPFHTPLLSKVQYGESVLFTAQIGSRYAFFQAYSAAEMANKLTAYYHSIAR